MTMNSLRRQVYSGNHAIDQSIHEMLAFFDAQSQTRMHRAILNAKKALEKHKDENTDAGARHIFREFIPAYELNRNGFNFEYEKKIQGRTPDWLDDIKKILMESYTFERGGTGTFYSRLSTAIDGKCHKYQNIVDEMALSLIISVHLDFLSGIDLDDCMDDVKSFSSIFKNNPVLTGILFFGESNVFNGIQRYNFFCVCRDSAVTQMEGWPFPCETI